MKKPKYDKTDIYEALHRFYEIVVTQGGKSIDISQINIDKPYYFVDVVVDKNSTIVDGVLRVKNSAFFEKATGLKDLYVRTSDEFEDSHIDITHVHQVYLSVLAKVPTGKFDDIYLHFVEGYEGGYAPAIVGKRKETDEEFNARVELKEQERKIEHEKYLARKKKREEKRTEEKMASKGQTVKKTPKSEAQKTLEDIEWYSDRKKKREEETAQIVEGITEKMDKWNRENDIMGNLS